MQWKFEFYCNWFVIHASQLHEVCVPLPNIRRRQSSDGQVLLSVRDRGRYVENLYFDFASVTRKTHFESFSNDLQKRYEHNIIGPAWLCISCSNKTIYKTYCRKSCFPFSRLHKSYYRLSTAFFQKTELKVLLKQLLNSHWASLQ